jgi:signal transduction histidine kinase
MTLRRLKWLTVFAPLIFLGALELLRHVLYPDLFRAWPGYLLLGGVILLGTLLFAEAVFSVVDRLQDQLTLQNQELLALHEAGLAIAGELDLETVLQRVVDRARVLMDARYGALSYLREEGGIAAFLTSGITADERARIGPLPVGHGLLGVVLSEGEHLRLTDLTRDPRSVGFPPHHPPMHSLLAVPIQSQGRVLGNLYLTEKETAPAFTAADEETLERLATLAALAIANARLHRQVRALAVIEERTRIAREMHDSVAQVLGYVNTKAQAAQTLLQDGQSDRAAVQIGQLAEAARAAYADVREEILGLRTSLGQEQGFLAALRTYLERWQDQSGIAVDLTVPDDTARWPHPSPSGEVQLLRIIQEALANIRKHAEARQATIRLLQDEGYVEAIVEDDGSGFAPEDLGRAAFPRFGLTTMRERAEAAGGTFAVASAPGAGTRVTVRIPVERTPSIATGDSGARAHR